MNRVVHFEIHADDIPRAKQFYEALFGWRIVAFEGPVEYWMVYTGPEDQPGINGGMIKRPHSAAGGGGLNAFPCTVDVDNIDAYLEKLQQAGGTVAVPKYHVPEVGWVAYGVDTEGNTFGLIQYDRGEEEKREV